MIELVDYERVPIGFEVAIVDGKEVTVPVWTATCSLVKKKTGMMKCASLTNYKGD